MDRPPARPGEAAAPADAWLGLTGTRIILPHLHATQAHLISWVLRLATAAKAGFQRVLRERRLELLREAGMRIGRDVLLPADTFIDADYCHLISIGDSCAFGPACVVLAHDPTARRFLGAIHVGRVLLLQSCHIGAKTIILPGVEIGPRTIVAANSVVSRSLPPETVCAGNPARPINSLTNYLEAYSQRIERSPSFAYDEYSLQYLTPRRRDDLIAALRAREGYIVGGRSAELRDTGGSERTPFGDYVPQEPRRTYEAHLDAG